MRVMLVDESRVNLTLMAHLLESLPEVEPVCFVEAAEALEWSVQHLAALALIDVRLPNHSGLKLMEALRREHPRLPVLMLVATHDAQTKHDVLQAGATDWIGKPVERTEFLARCSNALRLHALPGTLQRP